MSELKTALATKYKSGLVSFLQANPGCFDELLQLALSDDMDYAFGAAWAITLIMEKNDSRLRDCVAKMIRILPHRKDGHRRALLMILRNMEIPEASEGELFDFCVSIWETTSLAPALRSCAFQNILRIAEKYPDLQHEIQFLTEEKYLETLTKGVRHSVRLMMKEYDIQQ
ncbi:MAG: hypothetical protein LBE56_04110 [Tannerella sp.]|jgi:hypothetical protein|nr:hypothetical protein [Tannerella sp.]